MYGPAPPPGKRGFINVAREPPAMPPTDYRQPQPSLPKLRSSDRRSSEPKPDYTMARGSSKHNKLKPQLTMIKNELENHNLPVSKTSNRTERESQRETHHLPVSKTSSRTEREGQRSRPINPSNERHDHASVSKTSSGKDKEMQTSGRTNINRDPDKLQATKEWVDATNYPRHQRYHLLMAPEPPPKPSKPYKGLRRTTTYIDRQWTAGGPQVIRKDIPEGGKHPPNGRKYLPEGQNWSNYLMDEKNKEPRRQSSPKDHNDRLLPDEPPSSRQDPYLGRSRTSAYNQPHSHQPGARPRPELLRTDAGLRSYPAPEPRAQPYPAEARPQQYPTAQRPLSHPADPRLRPYPALATQQPYPADTRPHQPHPYRDDNPEPQVSSQLHLAGSTKPYPAGKMSPSYPVEGGIEPHPNMTNPQSYPAGAQPSIADPYPKTINASSTYPAKPGLYPQEQDAHRAAAPDSYQGRPNQHLADPNTYSVRPGLYPDGQEAYPAGTSNQYPTGPEAYPNRSDPFPPPTGSEAFQGGQNQYPEEYPRTDTEPHDSHPSAENADTGNPDLVHRNGNPEVFPYTEVGGPDPYPNTEAYPYFNGNRAVGYHADNSGLDAGRIDLNGVNGPPPQTAQTQEYSPQSPGQIPQYPPHSPGQVPQYPPASPDQAPQYPPQSPEYPEQAPQYSPQSPEYPGQPPQYPSQSPQYPPHSSEYPGESPQYPPQSEYPGELPQYPSQSPEYPVQSLKYPPKLPQYPAQSPEYPGQSPQYWAQQKAKPAPKPIKKFFRKK